jgi:hypothetical protein
MLYEVETCSQVFCHWQNAFSILSNSVQKLSVASDFMLGLLGNEGTPDSVNPSVVDEEEGLPSPPLDEGAFFTTQPTSMELSQVCFLFF